jgi:uncharacterized membrane protein YgaE (UPF0421/DUF939 family)
VISHGLRLLLASVLGWLAAAALTATTPGHSPDRYGVGLLFAAAVTAIALWRLSPGDQVQAIGAIGR